MSELAIRRGAAPALAVESLGYAYPQAARLALEDVSLEVAPGEFVVLAGRSASGKSTLLKAACGLVPHFHGGEIEGEVRVGGSRRGRHRPRCARQRGRLSRPGSGDAGRLDHGRGRDRAAAGAARRPAHRPRPLGRGGRPRPRDPAPARPRRRHPLRWRAAARRPGGSPRHPPQLDPPRRAHVTTGSSGRRRADLVAAAFERGVGGGRPAWPNTASSAVSPRPTGWWRWWRDASHSTALQPSSFLGLKALTPPWRPPPPASSRSPASNRFP